MPGPVLPAAQVEKPGPVAVRRLLRPGRSGLGGPPGAIDIGTRVPNPARIRRGTRRPTECLRQSLTTCSTDCAPGGSSRSSAMPATASTACSPPGSGPTTSRVHPGPARGDGRLRGLSATPSSAAGSASARPPAGPGAIHLLNGLYDAKLDHVPVVAIVGQTARSAMGGAYQQEVDLLSLFKDVASEYCQMVTVPEQLPNVLDRAMRIAASRRTVDRGDHPLRRAGARLLPARRTRSRWCPPASTRPGPRPVPTTRRPARAADVLNAGSKVAVLVGQGARGARPR